MSGLSGWTERDVQAWRDELESQRKGESTRKIGTTLVAAGISYIGAYVLTRNLYRWL
jgi:hypothetical protein